MVRSLVLTLLFITSVARADEHGPAAPSSKFPSHVFSRKAHQPPGTQLAFHYGLLQPLLMHGMNAAVDIRYRRLISTYSHGQGLDASSFETHSEKDGGMKLHMRWTTGGGVGVLLIDELYLLADFKVHRFDIDTPVDDRQYTNITVGAELGWRFFLWKGLNVALVARYWPNVYSSAGRGMTVRGSNGQTVFHHPAQQGIHGVFANVLIGWAFNL